MGGGGPSLYCKYHPRSEEGAATAWVIPALGCLPAGVEVDTTSSQNGREMPGAEFQAASLRLPGASVSGLGHSQSFLSIPHTRASGWSPGSVEISLYPGHPWDQTQEPRGHFKMLCVMENFNHALSSRTHSDPMGCPQTHSDLGGTDPISMTLIDLIRVLLIPGSCSLPEI